MRCAVQILKKRKLGVGALQSEVQEPFILLDRKWDLWDFHVKICSFKTSRWDALGHMFSGFFFGLLQYFHGAYDLSYLVSAWQGHSPSNYNRPRCFVKKPLPDEALNTKCFWRQISSCRPLISLSLYIYIHSLFIVEWYFCNHVQPISILLYDYMPL